MRGWILLIIIGLILAGGVLWITLSQNTSTTSLPLETPGTTPCEVPAGWTTVPSCPTPTSPAMQPPPGYKY